MSDEPHISYCGMGPWPIYVGFTTSKNAFRKEVARIAPGETVPFVTSSHANATTHYFTKDNCLTAIIAMEKPSKAWCFEQYAALVAHEAVHVCQELWKHIGESEPGKEAEAYTLQLIVQFCLQQAYGTKRERRVQP